MSTRLLSPPCHRVDVVNISSVARTSSTFFSLHFSSLALLFLSFLFSPPSDLLLLLIFLFDRRCSLCLEHPLQQRPGFILVDLLALTQILSLSL